jgi:uncharacterized membrane protein
MKLIHAAIAMVFILTGVMTLIAYPVMPDSVASHWDMAGNVDGTMPKFWGLVLIPLLMVGFTILFAVIPRIDPLRDNYREFQASYEGFILVFTIFLACIQLEIILWGLGFQVSPNLVMPVMIGILFICIGFLLERVEPNWFIGIRTPWTLSSDSVWKKTHVMGAKLFGLAGVVSMAGVLAGGYAWLFILVPAIAAAISAGGYSYYEFKKEQRTKQPDGRNTQGKL